MPVVVLVVIPLVIFLVIPLVILVVIPVVTLAVIPVVILVVQHHWSPTSLVGFNTLSSLHPLCRMTKRQTYFCFHGSSANLDGVFSLQDIFPYGNTS